MKMRRHLSVNIEGLLRNYKGRRISFMEDDSGRRMNDKEARAEISRLQSIGHKLIPCGDCEGFDPFGKGCPGHPIKEDPRDNPLTGDENYVHDVDMGAK